MINSTLLVLAFLPYFNIWFHVEDTDPLCWFGYQFYIETVRLFGYLSKCQIVVKNIVSGGAVNLRSISADTML